MCTTFWKGSAEFTFNSQLFRNTLVGRVMFMYGFHEAISREVFDSA